MGTFSHLIRTTAFRLTALYLLLFFAVAGGLVLYMTKSSIHILSQQTRTTLFDEVRSIKKVYEKGGIGLLSTIIEKRSRQPGALLYLLTDSFGQVLCGNVAYVETGTLCKHNHLDKPFSYVRYSDKKENTPHKAIAVIIDLPNRTKLLIGRDVGELESYLKIMRNGLITALGFMLLGGGLIWFLVGRRALQRIDAITKTSQNLMQGDLTGRLLVDGSGDEFDRLSNNLNGMLDSIEKLNLGLREVSDNLAHDLRTPLTHLRNKVEETLSRERNTEEYRDALEYVISKSDHLIRTFNAILLISRLEVTHSQVSFTPLALYPILEEAVEFYSPFAEEAHVKLLLEQGEGGLIQGNKELVVQALFNIIDNAIKYSKQGAQNPIVKVSIEEDKAHVRLIVRDNGPGIDEAERERATERFIRLEKSRTEPGFGIGLSLTKAIMRLHQGDLLLQSANPGLQVVLQFPKKLKA